jgi:hypothetical protein
MADCVRLHLGERRRRGGHERPDRAAGLRKHDVWFFGRPEMVGRAEAAGVRASAFRHARTDLDRYSVHPLPTVFGYTSSPAVGEELAGIVAASNPDVVVIDAMFAAALNVALSSATRPARCRLTRHSQPSHGP